MPQRLAGQSAPASAAIVRPSTTGDDFSFLIKERPGAYVWIGNGPGGPDGELHNARYDFNDDILPVAVGWMSEVAKLALADVAGDLNHKTKASSHDLSLIAAVPAIVYASSHERDFVMHDLTRCVHHPAVNTDGYASLAVATHRASTIVYPDAETFAQRKYRGFDGYTYGLHGTPTTRTLEAQLSELHGGVRTVLVPSARLPSPS